MHAHARIQEFSSGGGGVQFILTKKSSDKVFFLFSFFFPQLILQKSNGQFQRNLSFSRFQRESNIFQGGGGGPTFPRGSKCLFPIETHITYYFPGEGGSGTPVPPLDPHLVPTLSNH